MNKINILNKFNSFAWDFDKTLIDGKYSTIFRSFIKNNQDKNHYIVTFRDDFDTETIEEELQREQYYPLDYGHFKGVFNIPAEILNKYYNLHPYLSKTCHVNINENNKKLFRILDRENLSIDDFIKIKSDVHSWKATKAKEIGCEILIDDLEKIVKNDCDKLGIYFLNSIK